MQYFFLFKVYSDFKSPLIIAIENNDIEMINIILNNVDGNLDDNNNVYIMI